MRETTPEHGARAHDSPPGKRAGLVRKHRFGYTCGASDTVPDDTESPLVAQVAILALEQQQNNPWNDACGALRTSRNVLLQARRT